MEEQRARVCCLDLRLGHGPPILQVYLIESDEPFSAPGSRLQIPQHERIVPEPEKVRTVCSAREHIGFHLNKEPVQIVSTGDCWALPGALDSQIRLSQRRRKNDLAADQEVEPCAEGTKVSVAPVVGEPPVLEVSEVLSQDCRVDLFDCLLV